LLTESLADSNGAAVGDFFVWEGIPAVTSKSLAAHSLGVLGLACIGITAAAVSLDPILYVPGAVVALLFTGGAGILLRNATRYFVASVLSLIAIALLLSHYTVNEGVIAPSLSTASNFAVAVLIPAVVALPFSVAFIVRK